jgi:hypothetical protein
VIQEKYKPQQQQLCKEILKSMEDKNANPPIAGFACLLAAAVILARITEEDSEKMYEAFIDVLEKKESMKMEQ